MIDCCSVKSKDMRHCKEIRYYALKTTAATSPLIVRYLLLKISFHDWLQNICAVKVVEFWHEWSAWKSFFLTPLFVCVLVVCVYVCVCARVPDKATDLKRWEIFPVQTWNGTNALAKAVAKICTKYMAHKGNIHLSVLLSKSHSFSEVFLQENLKTDCVPN